MHAASHPLSALGRHGPALLVLSLFLGATVPSLSAFAVALVPAAAFFLTLGSFLSAALAPREGIRLKSFLPIVLVFVGLGGPALVIMFLRLVDLDPATEQAAMVAVLAPPVGSAAAISAMLGLRPRLALSVSILLTFLSPIILPVAAMLNYPTMSLDFGQVSNRLIAIVGLAVAVTSVVLRWRGVSLRYLPDESAAAGLSVIGLTIVGLAVMHGVAPMLVDTTRFISLMTLAIAINVCLCLVGLIVFLPSGLLNALTIGLLTGNRNVTLAWAVAGSSLTADAQSYLAICVIPVLSLPLIVKMVQIWIHGWAKHHAVLLGRTHSR